MDVVLLPSFCVSVVSVNVGAIAYGMLVAVVRLDVAALVGLGEPDVEHSISDSVRDAADDSDVVAVYTW